MRCFVRGTPIVANSHPEQKAQVWEVKAWTDYAADFPAKVLSVRKFTITLDQAEHNALGAWGVAVKWADQNLLDPMVVSLCRVQPPIESRP